MRLTIIQAIERAYNFSNLNSEDDDCIDMAINKYKVLRELNKEQKEKVYEEIAKRIGFMRY